MKWNSMKVKEEGSSSMLDSENLRTTILRKMELPPKVLYRDFLKNGFTSNVGASFSLTYV